MAQVELDLTNVVVLPREFFRVRMGEGLGLGLCWGMIRINRQNKWNKEGKGTLKS